MARNNRNNKPNHRSLTTSGRVVEKHPLAGDIYEMLKLRWSSEFIVSVLQERYRAQFASREFPPLPTSRTIRRYRTEHMPAKDVMPAPMLEEKFKGLQIKIDLFKSLQLAYQAAENRVTKFQESEEKLPLPIAGVDKAIESLLRIGEMLWRVGQDLGLYPRAMPPDFMAQLSAGARASAQTNIFVIDGEHKTVQMMTDEELDMSKAILKREVGDES